MVSGIVTAMPPVPIAELSLDDRALGVSVAESSKPSIEKSKGWSKLKWTLLAVAAGVAFLVFKRWREREREPHNVDPFNVTIYTPPLSPLGRISSAASAVSSNDTLLETFAVLETFAPQPSASQAAAAA